LLEFQKFHAVYVVPSRDPESESRVHSVRTKSWGPRLLQKLPTATLNWLLSPLVRELKKK